MGALDPPSRLTVGTLLGAPTKERMPDHPIYALSSRIVDEYARLLPSLATYLGIAGHDDRWEDRSPEGCAEVRAFLEASQTDVAALPPPEGPWDRLAVRAAEALIADELAHYVEEDHLRELNSIACPIQDYRQVFDLMGKDSREDWEAIAARLEGLPDLLAGYRASLELGISKGLVVARRQVHAAIEQSRAVAGDDSPFLLLETEFAGSDLGGDALKQRIAAGVLSARRTFGRLADFLETTYLSAAVDTDGVGRDRYLRAARRFLGSDLDPEETYAWGWTEVQRIHEEMVEVGEQLLPGGTLAEVLHLLKTDPGRSTANREEFVAFVEERLAAALIDLSGRHFDVPEEIRALSVKLAPPGGPLGAYYVGPSEDFARPGAVWWSLAGDGPFSMYDEVSTAYHEGFPGHHLQVGMQLAMAEHHSRLQRILMWYPGMGEGWALYAEQLMRDLGYLDEPEYVFGLLSVQMLRACRIVIDIGVHLDFAIPDDQPFHPGARWTFEAATEMLRDYATLDAEYAVSEATRYFGWPGQAIAYKIGERVISELRDERMRREGDAFDLKRFHTDLLEIGPVGLDLARELVLT